MKIFEAQWFTEKIKSDIQTAAIIRKKIDRLHEKVDTLCEPFAHEVMRQIALSDVSEKADIDEMIRMLPDCFYRFELRTALIEKFGR